MHRCAIVIPCYNEAARFDPQPFHDFLNQHQGIVFVLVNDGSRDSTLQVLHAAAKGFEDRIHVLDQQPNAGKGEAVRNGILFALNRGDAKAAGFFDADLATPLNAIPQLLEVLESNQNLQMVFGSRVKLLGRQIERKPIRHYLGRIFATVVSNLLRLPIYDTQCGAKLFRATPEIQTIFQNPFCSRWVFDVELIARFIVSRNKKMEDVANAIYEFPLHKWEDVAGSKVRPKDFFRAFLDVVKIRRRYF
jgi:dolichyl-phosphate beta-glucosyltransferase